MQEVEQLSVLALGVEPRSVLAELRVVPKMEHLQWLVDAPPAQTADQPLVPLPVDSMTAVDQLVAPAASLETVWELVVALQVSLQVLLRASVQH